MVHQTTARANAVDRQHDGNHGAERADGRSADLTRAASFAFLLIGCAFFFFGAGAFRTDEPVFCSAFGAAVLFAPDAMRSARASLWPLRGASSAKSSGFPERRGRRVRAFPVRVSSAPFCGRPAPLVSETIQSGVSSSLPTMMRIGSCGAGATGGLRLRRGAWRSSDMGVTSFKSKSGDNPANVHDVILYHTSFCRLTQGFFAHASRRADRAHSLNGGIWKTVLLNRR